MRSRKRFSSRRASWYEMAKQWHVQRSEATERPKSIRMWSRVRSLYRKWMASTVATRTVKCIKYLVYLDSSGDLGGCLQKTGNFAKTLCGQQPKLPYQIRDKLRVNRRRFDLSARFWEFVDCEKLRQQWFHREKYCVDVCSLCSWSIKVSTNRSSSELS